MANQNEEEKKGRALSKEELEEWRTGNALHEMEQTSEGWKVIKKMLEDAAFHSWIDPRECKDEKEFMWRELSAFHASNNAKELLTEVERLINRADYLGKIQSGEISVKKFKI